MEEKLNFEIFIMNNQRNHIMSYMSNIQPMVGYQIMTNDTDVYEITRVLITPHSNRLIIFVDKL